MTKTLLLFAFVTLCLDLTGKAPDKCDVDEDGETESQMEETENTGNKVKEKITNFYNFWPDIQCNLVNLDMVPNAFDDQYKGCSEIMQTDIMPKILNLEKTYNPQFGSAWNQAKIQWDKIKKTVRVPPDFEDEFGIAISVYTTDWPKNQAIYKMLNGNVSMAGVSRDYYMQKFHFKALHFYLTRALQVLRKNSKRQYQTYRGTVDSYEVSQAIFRFGRFTSSSLNIEVAKSYYDGIFFQLTTCFGVDIHRISSFPKEMEVLIPVAETFQHVGMKGNIYLMNSTCELCSFFNCAFLGEEKRKVADCSTAV
ncbi:ecto-ADP-ribosyltransferase 5-like isoform 2-T3 [Discoglossus pictus]